MFVEDILLSVRYRVYLCRDAGGENWKYHKGMLGKFPSIPNIPNPPFARAAQGV